MVYSYLSIKRNKVAICAITWRNCKNSRLSEKNPDIKGHILYDSISMKCSEQANPYR